MATTQRLGIDIVGVDKTRAAFMSAQRSLSAFSKTAAFATGALAGIAGGNLLKNMIQSFIQVNRHVDTVKNSFTLVDRAWQQFALNVGKGGMNESLINFNERIATMIIRLKGLSTLIGTAIGGAIDSLAVLFEGAGRSAAFLSDNVGALMGVLQKSRDIFRQTTGQQDGIKVFNVDDAVLGFLGKLGVKTDAFTQSLKTNKAELAALPKTFEEINKTSKDTETTFEKLTKISSRMWDETRTPLEKYKMGLQELNVLQANGLAGPDLYARQLAKLKEEFVGTGKVVKDSFNAMQEAGKTFASSFGSALKDLAGGTFSLKSALSDLLSGLTDLFQNRAMALLSGGSAGGFLGKLFGGSNFGGFYAAGGMLGAGKVGVAGENGPELVRGPATIIPSRNMGGPSYTLIDQRTNAPRIEHRQDSRGNIVAIVRDAVNDIIGSGQADPSMRNRFGATPAHARR